MANHKSAKKCIRKNIKKTAVNRNRVSRVRTFVKQAEVALGMHGQAPLSFDAAYPLFNAAQKELRRGVTKGVLKLNTVSRKISRLAKRLKNLQVA